MIDKSWYQRPPGVPDHESAGGIVVRVESGKVYVALVGEKKFNLYILPKGHVEDGESHEQAARREIAEEAGLTDLKLIKKLGIRERLDFQKESWKKTHYFLFTTNQINGKPTDTQRHYKVEWFLIDQLPEFVWPEQMELVVHERENIFKIIGDKKSEKSLSLTEMELPQN